jgi:hypothetical protein
MTINLSDKREAGQLTLSRRVRVALLLTVVVREAASRSVRSRYVLPPADLLHTIELTGRIEGR